MSNNKTKEYLKALLKIKSSIESIGLIKNQELDEMFDCVIEYNTLSIQNDILKRKCQFYEDTYFKELINERFGYFK